MNCLSVAVSSSSLFAGLLRRIPQARSSIGCIGRRHFHLLVLKPSTSPAAASACPTPYHGELSSTSGSSESLCGGGNRYVKLQPTLTQQRRAMASNTLYSFEGKVSPEHLETVKATLPLAGKAGTEFTAHFYGRLFADIPELKNIFNQTNQALGGQPKKLLKTVAVAAQAAIDTGTLPGEAIEGICQKHVALHIKPEQYQAVGKHILGTIQDLLTTDEKVIEAWKALYLAITEAFITREAEIADEVARTTGGWSGRRTFVLAGKERLSSNISRFVFKPVDGKPTPDFAAGKFTTIWVPTVGEEGIYGSYTEQPRHYTLALPKSPEEANQSMAVSIKKEGLVSRMLHDAEIGTEWDLSAPCGCFVMSGAEELWLSAPDAPVIFLSGGVGITPVLAMLESIYVTRPATWLHAAQNGAVHAYRDRLREIAAVRGGQLQRRVWYAKPLDEDGRPGGDENVPALFNLAKYHYKGHIDLKGQANELEPILHTDNPHAQYYMCGPRGFMDDQRAALMEMGVTEDQIHWEGF